MNPIVINAYRLLSTMIGARIEEWATYETEVLLAMKNKRLSAVQHLNHKFRRDYGGLVGISNKRLRELSGLRPEDIGDAIAWLEDRGAIVVGFGNRGRDPFDFRCVHQVTSKGKYLFHELKKAIEPRGGEGALPASPMPDSAKTSDSEGEYHTDPSYRPDRQYMELAFQEAKKSINEDGRPHPKVGAVVVKDGSILATAYRGETGPGDHAEFGALEKKLGQEVLSGATVYTTLEPCTSRQHPKVGCAQRLLERGVRRVVIGMHDPNPSIYRTGFRLLRSAKIETDLFPGDLMGVIEEINRDFMRTYSSADPVGPAARPSAREPWVKLENRLVDLEPLYDKSGQYSQYSSFRVEEVTDCDVKLQKESNSQTVFLPLSCLSSPWRADSYGGMRAIIERGKLSFDSGAQQWIYKP